MTQKTFERSIIAIIGLWFLLVAFGHSQTAVTLIPVPKAQFLDNSGVPLASGCVFTYAAGTTTPQTTYSESSGTSANTNPVILDSAGRANIWLAGQAYKFVLKSSGGVNCASGSTIWTVDGVDGDFLNFCSLSGCTFTGNVLPSTNGTLTLGASSFKWKGLFSDINAIRFVDGVKFTTIQSAITDAGSTGSVIINPNYGGADYFTNPNNIGVIDLRSGLNMYKAVDFNQGTSAIAYGDSITVGVNATTCNGLTGTCFIDLMAQSKAWIITNDGVSGSSIEDEGQTGTMLGATISSTSNSILLTGVNDSRVVLADTAKATSYMQSLMSDVAWLALPAANKITGQQVSGCTFVGAWSNTTFYGGTVGKYSTSNGDTVTCTVYGSTVYLTSAQIVGNTGTYTVAVDGVSYGTFSEASTLTTLAGTTYGPRLVRIAGLEDTVHTVVMTVTTAGQNVHFLWAGGNGGAFTRNGPSVFVGNCLRFSATGYVNYGGSNTTIATLNDYIQQAIGLLAADGLNVNLTDVTSYYNPDATPAQVSADGLHPNDLGHSKIANAFLQEMNGLTNNRDRGMAKNSFYRLAIPNNGNWYFRGALTTGSYYFQDTAANYVPQYAKSFLNGNASSAGLLFSSNDSYVRSGAAAANTHIQDGSANEYATFANGTTTFFGNTVLQSTNGATWTSGQSSELITLNTGGTTTDSAANLLPANSIITAVVARVTTTITAGCTGWEVGDPTTAARFTSNNVTLTAGTTGVGLNHQQGSVTTDAAGPVQTSAAKIRITCATAAPGAGAIRVTVFYQTFVPPTS